MQYLHLALVVWISFSMVFAPAFQTLVLAQTPAGIATDGRTETTITSGGANTFDVRTNTVHGVNAFNSFEKFGVAAGEAVNLHLPTQTINLINTVSGNSVSEINGQLKSLLANGTTGGNVFLMNPNGIVVGKDGAINVGSLGLSTPNREFIDSLYGGGPDTKFADIKINGDVVTQVLSGNVPLSTNGFVSVKGQINAGYSVSIQSAKVDIGDADAGNVAAGGAKIQLTPSLRVPLNTIINTQGLDAGIASDVVELNDGTIRITGTKGVTVQNATISASGVKNGSDGGTIVISAQPGDNNVATEIVNFVEVKDDQGRTMYDVTDQQIPPGSIAGLYDKDPNVPDSPIVTRTGSSGNYTYTLVDTSRSSSEVFVTAEAKNTLKFDANGRPYLYYNKDGTPITTQAEFKAKLDANGNIAADQYVTKLGMTAAMDAVFTGNVATVKGDLNIAASANILAEGVGATGRGGAIELLSLGNTTIAGTQNISVAQDVVNNPSSSAGGSILISAENQSSINLSGNMFNVANGGKVSLLARNISWDGGAGGVYFFTQTTHPGLNGNLSGANVSNGHLSISASDTITLNNVHISTRKISEGSVSTVAELWNLHAGNSLSTGNSGNVTISAQHFVMTNSEIITKAINDSGTTFKAGDVTIKLRDNNKEARSIGTAYLDNRTFAVSAAITNSKIDAGQYLNTTGAQTGGGTIKFEMIDNSMSNAFDYGGRASVGFRSDAASSFTSGAFVLDARAATGVNLGVDSAGWQNAGISFASLLLNYLGSALSSGKINKAATFIEFNSTVKTTGDVSIKAQSTSNAAVNTLGLNIGFAFSANEALSQVVIGSAANITSGKSVLIQSELLSKVTSSFSTLISIASLPTDIGVSVTDLHYKNTIDVLAGAKIVAAENVNIIAKSTLNITTSVKVTGKKDCLGIAVAFSKFALDTGVSSAGTITAGENVKIEATSDITNTTSAYILLGDAYFPTSEWARKIPILGRPVDALLKWFDGKFPTGELKEYVKAFGLAAGAAFQFSDVNTNIKISGGNITAQNGNIDINADTKNPYHVFVSSGVGTETHKPGEEPFKRKYAVSVGLPFIQQNNSTNVIIGSNQGAAAIVNILAKGNVKISAKTEVPYTITHPVYQWYEDVKAGKYSSLITDIPLGLWNMIQSPTGGLADGFVSSWSQSTATGEQLAIAGSISFLFLNNTTVAQVCKNVKIAGADGNSNATSVNISATTKTETANFSGPLRSFIRTLNPNSNTPHLQTMWGTEADKGVGFATMLEFIDNTTIARIDGGTIYADDISVSAKTEALDVAFALGGGNAKSFGLNGMAVSSKYNSYTLAKIDDEVQIGKLGTYAANGTVSEQLAANSVKVNAEDKIIRLGVAGSVTLSENIGVGMGMGLSLLDRSCYAIWGNVADENGVLQKIKGDAAIETLAAIAPVAVVNSQIEIKSYAHGVNVLAALAAVAVGSSSADNHLDLQMQANAAAGLGEAAAGAKGTIGISGDAAITIVTEKSVALLNGNQAILFNPNGTGKVGTSNTASFSVLAENSTFNFALTGSATLQSPTQNSSGIAGSYSHAKFTGLTFASLAPLQGIRLYENLRTGFSGTPTHTQFEVNAVRGGTLVELAIGGTGQMSIAGQGGGIQIAGSASYANITDKTISQIADTAILGFVNGVFQLGDTFGKNAETAGRTKSLTAAEKERLQTFTDIALKASNRADIINIAGGVAINGKVSVGAAVAVSDIRQNTTSQITDTAIRANSLAASATNDALIVAIAAAGGISFTTTNFIAIGGAASANIIDSAALVRIVNKTKPTDLVRIIDLTGDVVLAASGKVTRTANSTNDALDNSGEGSVWRNFNLADYIPQDVQELQKEQNRKLIYGDDVRDANAEDGLATTATPLGSTLDLGFGVSPTDSKIVSIALGAGIATSSGGATGAAVSVNQLTLKNAVELTNAVVHAGTANTSPAKNANVTAFSDGGIYSFGIGGAANAGKTGIFSAAATVGVNLINQDTLVTLNNSDLTLGNSLVRNSDGTEKEYASDPTLPTSKYNLNISATDKSRLVSVGAGGGVTVAGAVGVGTVVAYNQVGNSALVSVLNGSNVANYFGSVKLSGVTDAYITSVQISGGLSISGAVGVGVNVSINSLGAIGTSDSSRMEEDLQNALFAAYNFGKKTKTAHRSGVATSANSSIISDFGNIEIAAKNEGQIVAVALSFSFANVAAIGLASTYNNIGGVTLIDLKSTNLSAGNYKYNATERKLIAAVDLITEANKVAGLGNILLENLDAAKIVQVLAGGAGGPTFATGTSVGVNMIGQRVTTNLENSQLLATGSIHSSARTRGELIAVLASISGAGGVQVGIGVAYNDYRTKVETLINGGLVVAAIGDIQFRSGSDRNLVSVAVAGGGAGAVAVNASGAVNYLENSILTDVFGGAKVYSLQNVLLAAQTYDSIWTLTPALGGAGVVNVGGGVTVATINTYTSANIRGDGTEVAGYNLFAEPANGATTVQLWDRNGNRTTQKISGVGVVATNNQDVYSVSITGGGAGVVTVEAGASTVVNNTRTESLVSDAWIQRADTVSELYFAPFNVNNVLESHLNPSDKRSSDLLVRSLFFTNEYNITGQAGISAAVAVAVGTSISLMNPNTTALVKNLTVKPGNILQQWDNLDVFAGTTIVSKPIFLAGAGATYVAVDGGYSMLKIDGNTKAEIVNSSLSLKNLSLASDFNARTNLTSVLGGASAVAASAYVAHLMFNHNTISRIARTDEGAVNAASPIVTLLTSGTFSVSSNTTRTIKIVNTNVAAAIVGGVVNVNVFSIYGRTASEIGSSVYINDNAAVKAAGIDMFGDLESAPPSLAVSILSGDSIDINGVGTQVAVAGGAIGAMIDIIDIITSAQVVVGANSHIFSAGDITMSAKVQRDIGIIDTCITGGIGGLGAVTTVLTTGGKRLGDSVAVGDDTYSIAFRDKALSSQVNFAALYRGNGDPANDMLLGKREQLGVVKENPFLAANWTGKTAPITQEVTVGVVLGTGSQIQAQGKVDLNTRIGYGINSKTAAVNPAAIAIGAAVSVYSVKDSSLISIGGSVFGKESVSVKTEDLIYGHGGTNSNAYFGIGGGQVAGVGLAGIVSVFTVENNNTIQFTGNGQTISSGNWNTTGLIDVASTTKHRYEATTVEAQGALIGAGAAVQSYNNTSIAAILGKNAINFTTIRGDIRFLADIYSKSYINTTAAGGGVAQGLGAHSMLSSNQKSIIDFADNTTLAAGTGHSSSGGDTADGSLSIKSIAAADHDLTTKGVTVAGLGVGVSLTTLTSNLDAMIRFGASARLSGETVLIDAQTNQIKGDATATSGAGSLIGTSNAHGKNRGTHNASVVFGNNANITTLRKRNSSEEFASWMIADDDKIVDAINFDNGGLLFDTADIFQIVIGVKTNVNAKSNVTAGSGSLGIGIGSDIALQDYATSSLVSFGSDAQLAAAGIKTVAQNDANIFADVYGGMGSLGISVPISKLTNYYAATSRILFAQNTDAFVGKSNITTSSLQMRTIAGGTVNGKMDSRSGSVVASGTRGDMDSRFSATSLIDLANIQIAATKSAQIIASTNIIRDKNSSYAGSGAAIVGAGETAYDVYIAADAAVRIGDRAKISVLGSQYEGTLDILAQNIINSFDSYSLLAGGAVAVAVATGKLIADKINATVTVGKNVSLIAGDRLTLGTNDKLEIESRVSANAAGVAGSPNSDSTAKIHINNLVSVGDNTSLLSFGELFIGAGSVGEYGHNQIRIVAASHSQSGTLIPIATLVNMATDFTYAADVILGINSTARAVGNVSLLSQIGSVSIQKIEHSANLYATIRDSGFHKIFNDASNVSAGSRSDLKGVIAQTGGVTIGGRVEAGIRSQGNFTINADGSLAPTNAEWITYHKLLNQSLDQNFDDRIKALQKQYNDFAQSIPPANRDTDPYLLAIKESISRLETEKAKFAGKKADFFVFDPIRVAAGDVVLLGNFVKTNGNTAALVANGSPVVNIVNNSGFYLQTGMIEMLDQGSGTIRFNNLSVLNNADINKINSDGYKSAAAFQQIKYDPIKNAPLISIVSNNTTTPKPEIWLTGTITNPVGTLRIDSSGTIRQSGTIRAKNIEIVSGGDFIQEYTLGFSHIGGAPTMNDGVKRAVANFDATVKNLKSNYFTSQMIPELSSSNSVLMAGGSIFISAEYLNICGAIVSGYANFNFDFNLGTIGAEIALIIAKYRSGQLTNPVVDITAIVATANGVDSRLVKLATKVTFNAATETINIGDMVSNGGSITLFGNIMSTGGGMLLAQDGYVPVNINNPFDYTLNLGRIDIAGGAAGTIRITDTSKLVTDIGGQQRISVMEYKRVGGVTEVWQNVGHAGAMVKVTGLPLGKYATTLDRWYSWAVTQDVDVSKYNQEERVYILGVYHRRYPIRENINTPVEHPKKLYYAETLMTTQGVRDMLTRAGIAVPADMSTKDMLALYTIAKSNERATDWRFEHQNNNIVNRYEYWGRMTYWTENKFFYYFLNASREVDIAFAGDPAVQNINITSGGSINIGNDIKGLAQINITTNHGNITRSQTTGTIFGNNVSLAANNTNNTAGMGKIGTEAAPIIITQPKLPALAGNNDVSILNVTAKNDAYLYNPQSGIVLNDISVTGGSFNVVAMGDITQTQAGQNPYLNNTQVGSPLAKGGVVKAEGVKLVSTSGQIGTGTQNGGLFRIETASNNRTASSNVNAFARGSVYLHELGAASGGTDSDMFLGLIESQQGDVYIKVDGGGVYDGNAEFIPEYFTSKEWEKSLLDIGFVAGDVATKNNEDTIRYWELGNTVLYHEFWGYGKTVVYDASYKFEFTAAERQQMMEQIGQQFTTEMIDTEENRRTAFYHDVYFGGQGANAIYNANFKHTITAAEQTALLRGTGTTFEQISKSVPLEAYLIRDPRLTPKSPNIIGHNITLNLDAGVGRLQDSKTFAAGTTYASLSDADKLLLQTVTLGDVSFVLDASGNITEMVVKQFKDVSVQTRKNAAGEAGTLNITSHGGTYIQSPSDLKIGQITTQSKTDAGKYYDLRLNVFGNLTGSSLTAAHLPHLYVGNITLNVFGTIGSSVNSLRIQQGKLVELVDTTKLATINSWSELDTYLNFFSDLYVRSITAKKGVLELLSHSNHSIYADADWPTSLSNLAAETVSLTGDNLGTDSRRLYIVSTTASAPSVSIDISRDAYIYSENSLLFEKLKTNNGVLDILTKNDLNLNCIVAIHSGIGLVLESQTGAVNVLKKIVNDSPTNTDSFVKITAALDVIAQAEISAGKVDIVSNNKNVDLRGNVAALLHDLTISAAAGNVIAKNLSAAENLLITGATISLHDATAGKSATLTATGNITATGTILAGTTLNMNSSGGAISLVTAKSTGAATLNAAGEVKSTALVESGDTLSITGGTISLKDTTSQTSTSLTATGNIAATGTILAGTTLNMNSGGNVSLVTAKSTGAATLNAAGEVKSTSLVESGDALTITGGTISLKDTTSATSTALTATGNITATGTILAGTTLNMNSGGAIALVTAKSTGAATLNAAGNITSSNLVDSGATLNVVSTGGAISLVTAKSVGAATLNAAGNITSSNLIDSGATLNIASTGGNVSLVTAKSTGAATLNAAGEVKSTALVESGDALMITGGTISLKDATSATSTAMSATGNITATGTILAGTTLNMNSGGAISLVTAKSVGAATLNAAGNITSSNLVDSGATLNVVSTGGAISLVTAKSVGAATLNAAGNITSSNLVDAGATLNVASTGGNVSLVTAKSTGAATLNAAGEVKSTALVESGDALTITGGTISLKDATSATSTAMSATGNIAATGTILAGTTLNVNSTGGAVSLQNVSANVVTIDAGLNVMLRGNLAARAGDVVITSRGGSFIQSSGSVLTVHNATSDANIVIAAARDVRLGTLQTADSGEIKLTATSGKIANNNTSSALNIDAPNAVVSLVAGAGIGDAMNDLIVGTFGALHTNIKTLNAIATNGSAHFYNSNPNGATVDTLLDSIRVNQGNFSFVSDGNVAVNSIIAGMNGTSSTSDVYIDSSKNIVVNANGLIRAVGEISLIGSGVDSQILTAHTSAADAPTLEAALINLYSINRVGGKVLSEYFTAWMQGTVSGYGKNGVTLRQLWANNAFKVEIGSFFSEETINIVLPDAALLVIDTLVAKDLIFENWRDSIDPNTDFDSDGNIVKPEGWSFWDWLIQERDWTGTGGFLVVRNFSEYELLEVNRSAEMKRNNEHTLRLPFGKPVGVYAELQSIIVPNLILESITLAGRTNPLVVKVDNLIVGTVNFVDNGSGLPIVLRISGYDLSGDPNVIKEASFVAFGEVFGEVPAVFENFTVREAYINVVNANRLDFVNMSTSRNITVAHDSQITQFDPSKRAFNNGTHLWNQNGRGNMTIEPSRVWTDAFVINYDPHLIINGKFSSQNSVERMMQREMSAYLSPNLFRTLWQINARPAFLTE